jgi:1-acyl-sn-glycerol-3-phosphate acyltransferase
MGMYKFIFYKLLGWKIQNSFKKEKIRKSFIIVVPHTSWHDFYIGVFVRKLLNTQINFVGKKELFVWPLGYYFRWMGGAPLNRSKNQNKVESIAAIFESRDEFRLALAPEGTRKKVDSWRTGFYYIAQAANVPIIPVSFNYKVKVVTIGDAFYPTGDIEKDTVVLQKFFDGVEGKVLGNT